MSVNCSRSVLFSGLLILLNLCGHVLLGYVTWHWPHSHGQINVGENQRDNQEWTIWQKKTTHGKVKRWTTIHEPHQKQRWTQVFTKGKQFLPLIDWCQVFMIRSVFPMPYNNASPFTHCLRRVKRVNIDQTCTCN